MNNELNQIWTVLPKIYIFGLELGGPWHSGAHGHCPPYCYATAHSQSSRMIQLNDVSNSIRYNNSNLGGKTMKGRTFHYILAYCTKSVALLTLMMMMMMTVTELVWCIVAMTTVL